jgi:alpha-tubulin suppressor-like RCC1 family protein
MNRTARVLSLLAGLSLLSAPTWAADPAVAAGAYHVFLLMPDGTVRSWGTNTQGMLGDGTNQTRTTPVSVLETPPPDTPPSTPLSDVIAIATGMYSGYALKSDHTVWAWGANGHGELGDGTATARNTASAIAGLTNVTAIVAGPQYALALKDDGTVWMWGYNIYGQKGDGTWGSSDYVTTPVQIEALGSDNTGIGASESAYQTAYAIKTDGTVWAWGFNQFCTLGTGPTCSYQQPSLPVQTSGLSNVSAVAPGGSTTYAIDTTGQLYSWGDNQWGQVGNSSTLRQATPVAIASLTSVTAVSGGGAHALAALADGTVWAWGNNTTGQLGNGTAGYSVVPIPISGPTNVIAVAGGTYFSVAVSSDGHVWTWGDNYYYQLGDGTNWDSTVPLEIFGEGFAPRTARPRFSYLPGTYNATFNVVVTSDTPGATIHYTTNGVDPTTSDPTVASGGSVAIASNTTLKAKAWADGMPESTVQVAAYTMKVVTPSFSPSGGTFTQTTNVTISTTTSSATIRYTTDGSTPTAGSTLYSGPISLGTTGTLKAVAFKTNWADSAVGSGSYTFNFGPLNTPTASPTGGTFEGQVLVTLTADTGATIRYTTNGADPTATSTAYTQPLAISTTTTLKAKAFQTDHPTSTTMTQVYTIRAATPTFTRTSGTYSPGDMVTISGDAGTTLRITLNGVDPVSTDPVIGSATSLLVGGYTIKLRAFKTGNTDSNVAAATYSLTSPLSGGSVAAGASYSALATPDGLVYGWGLNTSGQLGDSTTTTRTTPKLVPTLTGVTKLAAGAAHVLALTWDGRLFAWGNDGSGRLGDGGTTNQSTPKWINAISNVVAVAAGSGHSLALTASGQVYAWGVGSNGQLGLGNTSSASTPTLISTLTNIVAIGAGDNHSFAVTSSGQLYAWGFNGSSQLGDGGTAQQTSPKLITGISGVAAVMGGASHSIARLTSGAVYTWGANSNGQLGQGNTTPRTTPTVVSGLSIGALVNSGSAFGAAMRSDGVLLEWGLNTSYQLGTTTPSQQTAPTVVAGVPSNLALLATGTTHTVAVTPDGHVWTWGADGSGQLGDGVTGTNRATPQDVFTSAGSWGATPVPMLTLAPGTYHSTQTLSVSAMSGAVVHYTTTGATPTEADPVVSGPFSITQNINYGFRAFATGLQPSAAVVAPYDLQPLPPTLSPGPGTYASAQSIALQAAAGTTIRYTLDGSTPTASSLAYSTPIVVGSPTTLTARAFQAGWTTSTSTVAAYTFVLGAPSISPPGGIYTSAQTITLQAAAGTTIRYTTDGSTPSSGSAIYSAPLTLGSSAMVRAIASEPGWADSLVNNQAYTIDSIGPVITATYFPSPNAAGWNHGPVEVSFFCTDAVTGVQSCPAPVTVSNEGEGQQVTVTATDVAGNQSSTTVGVNIDFTSPTVTVSTPTDGSVTTGNSIAMVAAVSDALSGAATATCNGTAATLSNGSITCQVPIQNGLNAIVMAARDAAGNMSSASVRVARTGSPTAIRLLPSSSSLAVGETKGMQLLDDFDLTPGEITWTTDDATIASVDASGLVTALAPGQATISATAGTLVANAEITVVSGALPLGTVRWQVPASSGALPWAATGLDRPDSITAALFEMTSDGNGGASSVRVRGFDVTGQQGFAISVPVPVGDRLTRAIGDTSGGALVVSRDGQVVLSHLLNSVDLVNTITRVSPEGAGWQYAAGQIEGTAQADDGTVFVVTRSVLEQPGPGTVTVEDLSIRGLDGETGRLKFEIPISQSTDVATNNDCPGNNLRFEWSPITAGAISVDVNGYANILVAQEEWQDYRVYSGGCQYLSDLTLSKTARVLLYRVSRAGTYTRTILAEYVDPKTADFDQNTAEYDDAVIRFDLGGGKPGSVLPDDRGGVLANWSVCQASELSPTAAFNCDHRARYVDNGVPAGEFSLPTDASEVASVSGANHVAYRGGASTTAFDMASGATFWTAPVAGTPTALADGRMEVLGPDAQSLTILSPTGEIESNIGLTVSLGQVASSGSETRLGISGAGLFGITPGLALNPFSGFALQAGSFLGDDASGRVYVDNTDGPADVLVRPEECDKEFFFVPAGQKSRNAAIDGVKPPAWHSVTDSSVLDWFKVINGLGVKITSSGTPQRLYPPSWSELTLGQLSPDADFDCLWCGPVDNEYNWYYHHFGGRKTEPEWSAVPPQGIDQWNWHPDWRYPTPRVPSPFPTRKEACSKAFRIPD